MTALVTSIYILQGCVSVGVFNGHSFDIQLLIEKDRSCRGYGTLLVQHSTIR